MKAPLSPSRPTDADSAAKLRGIYDEMRTRQRKAIEKAGALRSDPYFVPDGQLSANPDATPADALSGPDISTDDRRCLAVSSVIDESTECHWTPAFRELQRRLQEEFASYGLTFSQHPPKVGGGQLHWTLMQLVGFPDYDAEVLQEDTVYLSPQYLDCVQDSLTVGGLDTGIHINYVGVILVATGLLMIGVPSLDINEARDIVRSRLEVNKLPLREPFVNDICHSTLWRVAGDAKNMPKDLHVRLMELAKEYANINLGTVVHRKFQVGPASWRVLSSEMQATPPARRWELTAETPEETFNANVMDERGFTVSGASGQKLANELRQVLSRQISEVNDRKGQAISVPDLPIMRPMTPPTRENKEEIGDQKEDMASPAALEEMKNVHEEVRERIDELEVRDSIPRASSIATNKQHLETLDGGMYDNAATISGAAGLALAQELQKKLEEEQRALDRMYYTNFY
mmetsp:Transcript_20893/g.59920  ORF Transcript_20893/g.59920 Transcript_20893/m.59920 type:complete len:459 (+) Transcript_20893:68-1444(+)